MAVPWAIPKLEFRVEPLDVGARSLIRQTAIFDPRGVAGRLYWYGVLPLHALVFRGLLRRIAEHAGPCLAPGHASTFTYGSIIGAPTAEVFRWHEQPGALAALKPARLVRIEQQAGGIRDGGRVTVSIGVGSLRLRWVLRHYGYIAGRRFCDEQVRGPFAVWRHTHLFEPIGSSQTLYQDRIEFAGLHLGNSMRQRSHAMVADRQHLALEPVLLGGGDLVAEYIDDIVIGQGGYDPNGAPANGLMAVPVLYK